MKKKTKWCNYQYIPQMIISASNYEKSATLSEQGTDRVSLNVIEPKPKSVIKCEKDKNMVK